MLVVVVVFTRPRHGQRSPGSRNLRVGRARLNEPRALLRLKIRRRRKRGEPRRRGKRTAAARTTLLLCRETRVVEPPALAGVLVVPRLTSEPAQVARRRVVHAPEELARAALLPRREPRVRNFGGSDCETRAELMGSENA